MVMVYFYPEDCDTDEVMGLLEEVEDDNQFIYADVCSDQMGVPSWVVLLTKKSCFFIHVKHDVAIAALVDDRRVIKLHDLELEFLDERCTDNFESKLSSIEWLRYEMDFMNEYTFLRHIIQENTDYVIDTNNEGTSVKSMICPIIHLTLVNEYFNTIK